MALINCTECNKAISSKSAACPQCGCPIVDSQKEKVEKKRSSSRPKRASTFLILIIFLTGLYGVKLFIESGSPGIWGIEGEVINLILFCLLFLILLKLMLSLVRFLGGAGKVGGFLLLLVVIISLLNQGDDDIERITQQLESQVDELLSVAEWKRNAGYDYVPGTIQGSKNSLFGRVGRPFNEQQRGQSYYLYWQCSDGRVQLEVYGHLYEEGTIIGKGLNVY